LENSIKASNQWDEFIENCDDVEYFKKMFHLRPTASKNQSVTIVSSLEGKPMRGRRVGKTAVKKWLKAIYQVMMSDKPMEEKLQYLTQNDFTYRAKKSNKEREEIYQAKMIAGMSENKLLKSFLKVDKLIFIASEFILKEKSEEEGVRIDIIGFDGQYRLFFFELKTYESTDDAEGQTKKQIAYYQERQQDMLKVLQHYPISAITTDKIVIEGYAVIGYGDEIDKQSSKMFVNKEEVGRIVFTN